MPRNPNGIRNYDEASCKRIEFIKLIFILNLKKGKEKILQRQNSTKQIIIKK